MHVKSGIRSRLNQWRKKAIGTMGIGCENDIENYICVGPRTKQAWMCIGINRLGEDGNIGKD